MCCIWGLLVISPMTYYFSFKMREWAYEYDDGFKPVAGIVGTFELWRRKKGNNNIQIAENSYALNKERLG